MPNNVPFGLFGVGWAGYRFSLVATPAILSPGTVYG